MKDQTEKLARSQEMSAKVAQLLTQRVKTAQAQFADPARP